MTLKDSSYGELMTILDALPIVTEWGAGPVHLLPTLEQLRKLEMKSFINQVSVLSGLRADILCVDNLG